MNKEIKMKHNCKDCKKLSKVYTEKSEDYMEMSKYFADKCHCKDDE